MAISIVEHDINFHRSILKASQNDVLVRVWDTLAIDLRIRAVIGKISDDMRDVVESHQPIVDALEKGRGREAGLLRGSTMGWCDSTTSRMSSEIFPITARIRKSIAKVSHTRTRTSFCDASKMVRWKLMSCSTIEIAIANRRAHGS